MRKVLSSFFAWLENEDYIVKSPVRRIHKVKATKKVKETKTIDLLFEIDTNVEKPMAIYYYEQYGDGQKGNKYYIYYK